MKNTLVDQLTARMTHIISETNGLSLIETLDLLEAAQTLPEAIKNEVIDFKTLLHSYQINQTDIESLINHPVGQSLFRFFKRFPLRFREEHIHLTGSLDASFVWPHLKKLLEGPNRDLYLKKLKAVYGDDANAIQSEKDVDNLIRLKDGERFDRYLEILLASKLFLTTREAHQEASYHLAESLWTKYNIGSIRLKFTLSRATNIVSEQIPGIENLTPEDVLLGLYEGFHAFQEKHPNFEFILSPCFRKETDFFDSSRFASKKEDFDHQVNELINLLKRFPHVREHIVEVDTVGSERALFRKSDFQVMKVGFRKLQSVGLKIRSHHGETWDTLKKGIQSVDNAMNIWHVDAIEHGLSLGINPNFYYHSMFQRIMHNNRRGEPIDNGSIEFRELNEMNWGEHGPIREKLIKGTQLNDTEFTRFVKTKFHTARETEHYQHDIINRMIDKGLSVIALPSSNKKLTGQFKDYKDHPFSWWEKKGMKLGVGTDNYITLNTNYIREMLILLFTDASHLKITKLLLVCTGETRRPYMSQKLWELRKVTPLEED